MRIGTELFALIVCNTASPVFLGSIISRITRSMLLHSICKCFQGRCTGILGFWNERTHFKAIQYRCSDHCNKTKYKRDSRLSNNPITIRASFKVYLDGAFSMPILQRGGALWRQENTLIAKISRNIRMMFPSDGVD